MRFALIGLALTLTFGIAGTAGAAQNGGEPPEYAIGPEDVLEVSVWGNTEVSRTVPVRPDGRISLPLLNDIVAAGQTPEQLRAAIAKALAAFIPNASVSIIVREIHSFKVTVLGEVKAPGRFELRSRATVLDVIAMAGGLTQYATRGRVAILRSDGEGVRDVAFDFEKLTARPPGRATPPDAVWLRPGDIVIVP